MLGGDLNGDPSDFDCLQAELEAHNLIDVGSQQAFTSQINAPTCFTQSGQPTRRDYLFADRCLVEHIRALDIIEVDSIPTHRLLRLQMRFSGQTPVTKLRTSSSLTSYLQLAIRNNTAVLPTLLDEC